MPKPKPQLKNTPQATPLVPPLAVPLVLDFDGTLQFGDLSLIALKWLAHAHPWQAFLIILTGVIRGKPMAKLVLEEAAFKANFQPIICWNMPLIKAAKASKQPILVATGSPERWVAALLHEAKLDWPVLGTTAHSGNFIGPIKAAALVAKFGQGGFDYAGNSRADLAVWQACRHAWLVNTKGRLVKQARKLCHIEKEFPTA